MAARDDAVRQPRRLRAEQERDWPIVPQRLDDVWHDCVGRSHILLAEQAADVGRGADDEDAIANRVAQIGDDACVVEDCLAVGGHLPGVGIGAISARRDQDEIAQSEVGHDAGGRAEVAGVVGFEQDDACMLERHGGPACV